MGDNTPMPSRQDPGARSFAAIVAVTAVTTLAALAFPRDAWACGASGPGGVSACSLSEHEESLRLRFRVGASAVHTSTTLRFSGGLRPDQTRSLVLGTLGYNPTRRLSLQLSLGSPIGGSMGMPDGDHRFDPGLAGAIGASFRLVEGQPFVVLTSTLSALGTTTRTPGTQTRVGYGAFDLRVGAIAGVTLFRAISPYAAARAFGGPAYWRYQGTAVTGTDVFHYQLGGGLAVLFGKRVEGFIEGIPLGERAVSGGVALAF
jgi:hypothetical protein